MNRLCIWMFLTTVGIICGMLVGGYVADQDNWKRKVDREIQNQIKVDLKFEERIKNLEVPRLPLIIE